MSAFFRRTIVRNFTVMRSTDRVRNALQQITPKKTRKQRRQMMMICGYQQSLFINLSVLRILKDFSGRVKIL
jgi:hypothetical protein